ncbi:MAG: methylated-DNA-[protein]-cysteine S-methyltransferase [Cyanobacteria bacterium RYN_339]|nr:methylated-DNA-[protein]-cysteine S-methyltransferase [Cyanobacteria bacterium RYN_339]
MFLTRSFPSPLCPLLAVASERGLVALAFADPQDPSNEPWLKKRFGAQPLVAGDAPALDAVGHWLAGYFSGQPGPPQAVPLDLIGTPFERAVWQLLLEIPYGATTSYGALAKKLGKPPGAARAIGGAVGSNPLGVLVPCHRVLGAKGELTGYAGGLPKKRWLLHHEGALLFG